MELGFHGDDTLLDEQHFCAKGLRVINVNFHPVESHKHSISLTQCVKIKM